MKILITGANGFVGKNLVSHLNERDDIELMTFNREDSAKALAELVGKAGLIFHLAGVNRPENVKEFEEGNTDLTALLCEAILSTGRKIPVVYTSSIQADKDNHYGISKKRAEEKLLELHTMQGTPVKIFRLPNVFGKWARPNYNSAVATFCHNIARNLPIQINDPDAVINLVYIDDVIKSFLDVLDNKFLDFAFPLIEPQYTITVGKLAEQIYAFKESRQNLVTEPVGIGLVRALYSTYVSYFSPEDFIYEVTSHSDPRGTFVEMLKTPDAGQFSYFTAHPNITRGGHYHHSKTEKFLVIRGNARFGFRHIVTQEYYELFTSGDNPSIVETVPGWSHDITNVGNDEMIVMLWANEIFNQDQPDTYTSQVTL